MLYHPRTWVRISWVAFVGNQMLFLPPGVWMEASVPAREVLPATLSPRQNFAGATVREFSTGST